MRLVIVTDAWHPQVNGVVRTLERTRLELISMGHEVEIVSPEPFFTVPLPTYPEIRLSLATMRAVGVEIEKHTPDHIHIATEGPLGHAARRYCLASEKLFTTSYHTRFPEYVTARIPIPISWTYAYLRRFHNSGVGCMVATPTLRRNLEGHGFDRLRMWSRGVDASLYAPEKKIDLGFKGPIQLYVGRVAIEKNLEAFLSCKTPGTKLIVGDGPARAELEAKYPDAVFAGKKMGEELAGYYASADVFVFPSLTDTFGIVMLEALASGLPVAAFPVMGPIDVIGENSDVGILRDNLDDAISEALKLDRAACRRFAESYSWRATAELFLDNIVRSRNGNLTEAA
ncbi:MAG: glycosyltransferase family 1 protein [Pseudomonadota bacterium]